MADEAPDADIEPDDEPIEEPEDDTPIDDNDDENVPLDVLEDEPEDEPENEPEDDAPVINIDDENVPLAPSGVGDGVGGYREEPIKTFWSIIPAFIAAITGKKIDDSRKKKKGLESEVDIDNMSDTNE